MATPDQYAAWTLAGVAWWERFIEGGLEDSDGQVDASNADVVRSAEAGTLTGRKVG